MNCTWSFTPAISSSIFPQGIRDWLVILGEYWISSAPPGFLFRDACLQDKLTCHPSFKAASCIVWRTTEWEADHHCPFSCLGVCSADLIHSFHGPQGGDLRQRSRRPDFSHSSFLQSSFFQQESCYLDLHGFLWLFLIWHVSNLNGNLLVCMGFSLTSCLRFFLTSE